MSLLMEEAGGASAPGGSKSGRALAQLQSSGSTSRVLNLIRVLERDAEEDEYHSQPFFLNRMLNRSIILKHRLRDHEFPLVTDGRRTVTKVVLPFDPLDLKVGGRSFFVGQKDYEQVFEEIAPEAPVTARDRQVLDVLDGMPSLDPFILRERLRYAGLEPARCYFGISDQDTARMSAFTEKEMAPLIALTYGDRTEGMAKKAEKFAKMFLSSTPSEELMPFRQAMGLNKTQFEEGMFCWRGFIYYKWSLSDLAQNVKPMSQEIMSTKIAGRLLPDEVYFLSTERPRLIRLIAETANAVLEILKSYDAAFARMTQGGRILEFRDFLLEAPMVFDEVGERVGALQHLVSLWRYRFPNGPEGRVPVDDFMDILREFSKSLVFATL